MVKDSTFLMPVIFMNKGQPDVPKGVLGLKETRTVIPFIPITNHILPYT